MGRAARQLSIPLIAVARALPLRWLACLAAMLPARPLLADLPPAADRPIDFRRDVYPILSQRCFACHQGADAKSGHRLDDQAELLGETTGMPLVDVGRSDRSRLIAVVAGLDKSTVMPPKGPPLTAAEIGVLRAWIDQGLAWDAELLPPPRSRSDHWAFQPVQRPAVPSVADPARAANPIDAFLEAARAAAGVEAGPEADRRTLLRRLMLDLLGLPPSPEEVDAFLFDARPDAWERLVDACLASPQYGERWARHWLDVARWAETEGYESNHPRPFAWRYRDYVVRSFNEDRPYDEFIRQQLAGDELTPYSDENLIATGFLAAARLSSNEEDKWLQRNAVLVDVVNTVGQAFLGLTLQCAQCHNHKFDPITLRDYYRLQTFFLRGQPVNVTLQDAALRRDYEARRPAEYEPARALRLALFEAARARFVAKAREQLSSVQRAAVDTPADRRTVEQELLAREANLAFQSTPDGIERHIPEADRPLYNELKKKLAAVEKDGLAEPQTFAWHSPVSSPHELRVLPSIGFYPLPFDRVELAALRPYLKVRGEVHAIGPNVDAGPPAVFDGVIPRNTSTAAQPGTRTALAEWLADPRHPLTARVWVNRLWQGHFGRGLVETPSDFGVKGAPPTHAELLDWLAAELVASRGSAKHIHRLILTSQAYRVCSIADCGLRIADSTTEVQVSADAPNSTTNPQSAIRNPQFHFTPQSLYTRWSPRRLEAEALRDAMLAVSGRLDPAIGGPSVPLNESAASRRRGLYQFQKRGAPPDMQRLFDGPSESAESCPLRHTSITPLQSLFLLNDPFAVECAASLAARVRAIAAGDRPGQVDAAFRLVVSRPPHATERAAAERFFAEYRPDPQVPGDAADPLTVLCHTLLNLNEFSMID